MKLIFSTIRFLLIATCCTAAAPAPRTKQNPLVYRNPKYGIAFTLPKPWQGYTVVQEKWDASLQPSSDGSKPLRTEHGPIITLRNPHWTKKHPTQDIPILIFTRQQWKWEHDGKLFPYAGGILYELGHNQKYVLAIYSRFDAHELEGWEEAGRIVSDNLAKTKHRLYQQ